LTLLSACGQTAAPMALQAPRDGEIGVPTNAVVALRLVGFERPHEPKTLVDSKLTLTAAFPDGGLGAPEPLAITTRIHANPNEWRVRARPTNGLEVNTRYRLTWAPDGGEVVLGSFTTGFDPKLSQPEVPSDVNGSVDSAELSEVPSCDEVRLRSLEFHTPDGGEPLLLFNVYDDDLGRQLSSDERLPIQGYLLCSGALDRPLSQNWVTFPGSPRTLLLQPVDRAGNEGGVEGFSFSLHCEAGPQPKPFGADRPPGACSATGGVGLAALLLIAARIARARARTR
jgi:hypothetical protein